MYWRTATSTGIEPTQLQDSTSNLAVLKVHATTLGGWNMMQLKHYHHYLRETFGHFQYND